MTAKPIFPFKVDIYDTGLNEDELKVLREYFKQEYPEMSQTLLFPSKHSVPQDQLDSFEFCQHRHHSEFHANHRQMYNHARQHMDSSGNLQATKTEL